MPATATKRSRPYRATADILVEHGGPVCLVRGETTVGVSWLNANLPSWGSRVGAGSIGVIAPRNLAPVVRAAGADGLICYLRSV